MDKIFKKNDAVEALDTSAGVWRQAVVQLISSLTVTVIFPGFSAKKSCATEHIGEDLRQYPSKWPIRAQTPKPATDVQQPRTTRPRGGDAKLGADKASKLIIGDAVVFRKAGQEACQQEVIVNDPIFKTMLLTASATPFLVECDDMRLDILHMCNVDAETTSVSYDELIPALPTKEEPKDVEETPPPSPRRPAARKVPAPSIAPALPLTPAEPPPLIPAFLTSQNPDAHPITFAACVNGIVSMGQLVIWQGHEYKVKGIADNGRHRAIAHIVSDQDIEATVPCSLLNLKQCVAPSAPAQLPSCSFDLVQLAYAVVKENLLHLEAGHNRRPVENFEVMEFRSAFTTAFGFKGREVTYDLEAGETAQWDRIFGPRWDVVVGGEYLVAKISFKREKVGRKFAVTDKLRCHLDLINVDCTSSDYRRHAHARQMDKYRLPNAPAPTKEQLVPLFLRSPRAEDEPHQPHRTECTCELCF
jgi:hypothetical protein